MANARQPGDNTRDARDDAEIISLLESIDEHLLAALKEPIAQAGRTGQGPAPEDLRTVAGGSAPTPAKAPPVPPPGPDEAGPAAAAVPTPGPQQPPEGGLGALARQLAGDVAAIRQILADKLNGREPGLGAAAATAERPDKPAPVAQGASPPDADQATLGRKLEEINADKSPPRTAVADGGRTPARARGRDGAF
jgi:hypothetical protein